MWFEGRETVLYLYNGHFVTLGTRSHELPSSGVYVLLETTGDLRCCLMLLYRGSTIKGGSQ